MQRALVFLFAVTMFGVSACKSSGSSREDSHGFRSLLRGYGSGVRESGIRVARSQEEWTKLWAEHSAHTLPRPQAPDIDWKNEMVVCVLLGERPSGGFSIQVEEVDDQSKPWIVYARERVPAEGALVPMMMTAPYHMVVTERHDGEPRLVMRK
ncbi:MAG: protease complex subunit PrcB family protein [Planctomycetota bacterium]